MALARATVIARTSGFENAIVESKHIVKKINNNPYRMSWSCFLCLLISSRRASAPAGGRRASPGSL
eukprot:3271812-Heterocapsa_arctica.AAC.1